MENLSLKSVLKSWQEIVFIIAVGTLIFGITMNISVAFQQVVNIVAYCIFVSVLICLVSLLFKRRLILGMVLAIVFGLCSFYMFIGWIFDKEVQGTQDIRLLILRILSICLFAGLMVTAISMLIKYVRAHDQQANT